mgnify:FL=1
MTHSEILSGMRVLITRPEHLSENLALAVRNFGGHTVNFPLLEIKTITEESRISLLKYAIKKLDDYDILIFVSKNAVQYGTAIIKENWHKLSINSEVIAIGPGTAKMASDFFGCEVIHPENGSVSEDLVSLPSLINVEGKRIAIFRGTEGREFLAGNLKARGAKVDYFEVYERNSTKKSCHELIEVISENHINVLTITSGDSLNILNRLFLESRNTFPKFFHMPMVVPSARVGQLAAEFGFEQVKLAQGADTESMVSAICEVAPEVYKRDGK